MNNIIVSTDGGGIFSLYHIALTKIYDKYKYYTDDIGSFKIILDDNNYVFKNKYLFDSFFEYDEKLIESRNNVYINCDISPLKIIYKITDYTYGDIDVMKQIIKKNKINNSIDSFINNFVKETNISSNTLCVHIRLTDMNTTHANDYGVITFNDYKNEIDKHLILYPEINTIYVSSDNIESINKLFLLYNNDRIKVIAINHIFRVQLETSDNYNFIKKIANEHLEYPSIIFSEILIGSKCGYFIGRISSVTFFIILYSDTFKTIKYMN